jgi:hypothetical protein
MSSLRCPLLSRLASTRVATALEITTTNLKATLRAIMMIRLLTLRMTLMTHDLPLSFSEVRHGPVLDLRPFIRISLTYLTLFH